MAHLGSVGGCLTGTMLTVVPGAGLGLPITRGAAMFMQVIQGHVRDADGLRRAADEWRRELQPGATGFLGSTSGITADGMGVVVARFDTEASARANSARPEQSAWWEGTKSMFDGEVTFIDCPDCDVMMGGGSDDAHFVQLIEARVKDRDACATWVERWRTRCAPAVPTSSAASWVGTTTRSSSRSCTSPTRSTHEPASVRWTTNPQAAEWSTMVEGEPHFLDLRDPTYA